MSILETTKKGADMLSYNDGYLFLLQKLTVIKN